MTTTPLPEHPGQRAATVEFWRHKAALHGGQAQDDGPLVRTTLGFDERQWNGAWLLAPTDDGALLDRTAAFFAGHGKPWGLLTPQGLPGRLTSSLTAARMARLTQPVMVAPLDAETLAVAQAALRAVDNGHGPATRAVTGGNQPVDPAVTTGSVPADRAVRLVAATPDDLPRLVALSAGAFDLTPATLARFTAPELGARGFSHVLALVADEVVGTATLAVHEGMAGVYGVAVRTDHRRHGIGAALTAWCLHRGADAGCAQAYLSPSEVGLGVYRSLGFTEVAGWDVWLPPSTVRQSVDGGLGGAQVGRVVLDDL